MDRRWVTCPEVAEDYSVRVEHRDYLHDVIGKKLVKVFLVLEQFFDDPVDDEGAAGLTGVDPT